MDFLLITAAKKIAEAVTHHLVPTPPGPLDTIGIVTNLKPVRDILHKPLPEAAPKSKTHYKHVPGQTPHESILLSAMMFDLKDGSILTGLVQKTNGLWYYSEIDLNLHYSNKDGAFNSDDRYFKATGCNFSLHVSETKVLLKGELLDYKKHWRAAEVDLAICIVVKNGAFTFVRHDGWADRDGWLVDYVEDIPFAGFIAEALHSSHHNDDHAKRARARCFNSTLVTVSALIGGVGGFYVGGAVGAAVATPFAIIAESHIADTIDDPAIRDQFAEATIGRAIVDGLVNMIAPGVGGYVGKWLKAHGPKLVRSWIGRTTAGTAAGKGAAKAGAQKIKEIGDDSGEKSAIMVLEMVARVMEGDEAPLKQWKKVQNQVTKAHKAQQQVASKQRHEELHNYLAGGYASA